MSVPIQPVSLPRFRGHLSWRDTALGGSHGKAEAEEVHGRVQGGRGQAGPGRGPQHRPGGGRSGPDGDVGFGGACFPKDMIGILGLAKKLKIDMSALSAVWQKNLKIRKNRDWEHMTSAFRKRSN